MEIVSNMKCQLVKISWGIVEIGNTRVYAEFWLTTGPMNLKVKLKVPKGMSYSYVCSVKDAPFEDGQFLSYWIPKNIYFPVHFCGEDINSLVETVVEHLNIKFFNESRKWLTKDEKPLDRFKIGSDEWYNLAADPLHPLNVRQRVLDAYGRYQVNVSESVDGDVTPWISEWSEDGYVGVIVDTTYLDGSDTTDWCVFVGTRSECEAYIRKHVNY